MRVLQLKITLKYSRPPIWRRVLICPDATFWDLHSVIQDLFGWEGYHLHNFERAWKRNDDRYFFEVPHEDDFREFMTGMRAPRDYYHDERKEKLANWLTEECPIFWYTYDFGDNWEHEIKLEKHLDVPAFKLAKYLGGKRRGLEEDSRFEGLSDCTTLIKAKDTSSGLWQAIMEDSGKANADKLIARAQKESTSEAPKRISFSDPIQRYKDALEMGMFD